MPWKVSNAMDERMKFVRRILAGETMSAVCAEFDISRKTGHKIYNRFLEQGKAGLFDQSRRPRRLAKLLDTGLSNVFVQLKKDKPHWGAPKLRELFIKKYPTIKPPAISTIHALLGRNGLVNCRKKRNKYRACGTYLSIPQNPNDLWCTDFKGQFPLGNKSLCYPLTITDFVSRHIFEIDAMEKISEDETIAVFTEVFKEFGLPVAMRSDNGVPFSSRSIFGLSKLSVWWLRLGIKLERIKPGNPQQNGRHERMHKTLKQETTKPPAPHILSQQNKFDRFKEEFNSERPHEGLSMKTPSQVYKKSERIFPELLPEIKYPTADNIIRVTKCGSLYTPNSKKRMFIGMPLAGQNLGIRQLEQGLWTIEFMEYELGYFDDQSYKFCPSTENPFSLEENLDMEVLPMCPE